MGANSQLPEDVKAVSEDIYSEKWGKHLMEQTDRTLVAGEKAMENIMQNKTNETLSVSSCQNITIDVMKCENITVNVADSRQFDINIVDCKNYSIHTGK